MTAHIIHYVVYDVRQIDRNAGNEHVVTCLNMLSSMSAPD